MNKEIIYIVGSDIETSSFYAEFDNEAKAIDFAKKNLDKFPFVQKVVTEYDELGNETFTDYIDIWDHTMVEDTNTVSEEDAWDAMAAAYEEEEKNKYDLGDTTWFESVDANGLVEAMEENEDTVECKECFELFPKADCIKLDFGYICPTCADAGKLISVSDEDTFKVEFPEYEKFQDTTDIFSEEPVSVEDPVEPLGEPDLTPEGAIPFLVEDEEEAIAGYEKAAEVIEASDVENKEEILDTLDHIKEEEEEHIEELTDLVSDEIIEVENDPISEDEPLVEEYKVKFGYEDKPEQVFDKLEDAIKYINDGMKNKDSSSFTLFDANGKEMIWLDEYRDRDFSDIGYTVSRQNDKQTIEFDKKKGGLVIKDNTPTPEDNKAVKQLVVSETVKLKAYSAGQKFNSCRFVLDNKEESHLDLENGIVYFNDHESISEMTEKLVNEFRSKKESFKESTDSNDVDTYIKSLVANDFKKGMPFDPVDDFELFKQVASEDGYTVTEDDFDKYFTYLDEIRGESLEQSMNEEQLTELFGFGKKKEKKNLYLMAMFRDSSGRLATGDIWREIMYILRDHLDSSSINSNSTRNYFGRVMDQCEFTTTEFKFNRIKHDINFFVGDLHNKPRYFSGYDYINGKGESNPDIKRSAENLIQFACVKQDVKESLAEEDAELLEHVNEEHPAIESDQELQGIDNAVVDCKVAKVITHSEDEKPLNCEMKDKPLEKPLTEELDLTHGYDHIKSVATLVHKAVDNYTKDNRVGTQPSGTAFYVIADKTSSDPEEMKKLIVDTLKDNGYEPEIVKYVEKGTAYGYLVDQIKALARMTMSYQNKIKESLYNFTEEEMKEFNMDEDGVSLDSYDEYVRCNWCDEVFAKSDCEFEANLGWLCDRCYEAITSRGEKLTIIKNPTDEDIAKTLTEEIKMTAKELKDKFGTDDVDLINAGREPEERVELTEDADETELTSDPAEKNPGENVKMANTSSTSGMDFEEACKKFGIEIEE